MSEFQNRKAQQELASALGRLGLQLGPGMNPSAGAGIPMGPGETAPATLGDLPQLAPGYLPPEPAEAVPTAPLEPPPEK